MFSKKVLIFFLIIGLVEVVQSFQKYTPVPTSPPKHVRVPHPRVDDPERDVFYYDTFPDDFQWGFATASYQIEGGWNEDGKGESIWDTFSHSDPCKVAQCHTGDVACDSYHRIQQDIQALKDIGAHFYRFSLSWTRIIPTGTLADGVNQAGIDYYNALIDALIAEGITPFVTLYHWDLPQPLQDIGGWPNEELAQHFADLASVAFANFGDRVKNWITFNEPYVFLMNGYIHGSHAPGYRLPPAEIPYQGVHTIIKSHALAYRVYESDFMENQQGRIGITLDSGWSEPTDRENPDDMAASERAMQFHYGWFANPLFRGEYPPIMRQMIDEKSVAEGRNSSRLPTFDPAWTWIINGTLDFFGLNHYSSGYVFSNDGGPPGPNGDSNTGGWSDPNWDQTAASWLKVVPWGLRRVINWISNEYGNQPLYITENGSADRDEDGVVDAARVNYYLKYIDEMLKAVKIDGNNVKGYTAWSLIDNFEWAQGYTQRFGVHYVNWTDPSLTRVQKDSARLLARVIRDNGFPAPIPNSNNS